jgi:phage-related minor tail protein
MTADEFRQEADAICAEFEGRLDDLGRPESLDDLQNFVSEAVPIIEEGNAQLQELNPPDELQEQWDRAMEINNEQLETVRDLREAVEDGDQARAQELIEAGNEANTEADQLAADLGLEDCGSD